MPIKFESNRVHSNPNLPARKRTQIIVIVGVIALVALLLRPDRRALTSKSEETMPMADSQKTLSQQQRTMTEDKGASVDTRTEEKKVEPVSAEHANSEVKGADKTAETTSTTHGVNKTAKIVTCPGCRLNSLPLVKKFVHELAPNFKPDLEVDFQVGQDPVLHFYEDGIETSAINLEVQWFNSQTSYNSMSKLTYFQSCWLQFAYNSLTFAFFTFISLFHSAPWRYYTEIFLGGHHQRVGQVRD